MAKATTGEKPTHEYHAPQKLLIPCPTCGRTVLRGLCTEGRVKALAQSLTPVFGDDHHCPPAPATQETTA